MPNHPGEAKIRPSQLAAHASLEDSRRLATPHAFHRITAWQTIIFGEGIMTTAKTRRPFWAYLLVFFCVVLGAGGLYGGYSFVTDPTGASMGMDVSMLRGFLDTFLPFGFFLLIAFGLAPLVLAWTLIARPQWFPGITRSVGREWEWVITLAMGVGLLIWMAGQFVIMGYAAPIQAFTTFLGAVITLLSLVPAVRRYYRVG